MPSRRTHTKSRNGCIECKRRRIKCDERTPSCFNCSRYGAVCFYGGRTRFPPTPRTSFNAPGSLGPPLLAGPSTTALAPTRTGGMLFNFNFNSIVCEAAARNLDLYVTPLINLVNTTRVLGNSPDGTGTIVHPAGPDHHWTADMELMHHWTTETANTMAGRDDMRHVWRVILPREGTRHPFVLHGILSLAALHKAHVLGGPATAEGRYYQDVSAYHQSTGLGKFLTLLATAGNASDQNDDHAVVDDQTWYSVFMFSSCIIATSCAAAPRSLSTLFPLVSSVDEDQPSPASSEGKSDGGEELLSPIASTLELFSVIRGVRGALGSRINNIIMSDMLPLARGVVKDEIDEDEDDDDQTKGDSLLPAGTFTAFRKLLSWASAPRPYQEQGPNNMMLEPIAAYPTPGKEDEKNLSLDEECRASVEYLIFCAKQIRAAGKDAEKGSGMLFPFFIPERWSRAELLQPPSSTRALVMLAHWAVLSSLFENECWYLRGWGKALVGEIETVLFMRSTMGQEEGALAADTTGYLVAAAADAVEGLEMLQWAKKCTCGVSP